MKPLQSRGVKLRPFRLSFLLGLALVLVVLPQAFELKLDSDFRSGLIKVVVEVLSLS